MNCRYFPKVVQAVPFDDYTVTVYFDDGKIVQYDVKPHLKSGIFQKLQDLKTFMDTCTVMNETLAWDIHRNRNEYDCIDIDPESLHALPCSSERFA